MVSRRAVGLSFVVVLLVALVPAVAWYFVPATADLPGDGYDEARVTIIDDRERTLGVAGVQVADTPQERYTGLSETASLPENEGMLFVYRDVGERSYVMRNMSFPLDMVFVGGDGRITAIHHAPVPPEGSTSAELTRYSGRAQWVLEVPRGWTADHGVAVGDRVEVEYRNDTQTSE